MKIVVFGANGPTGRLLTRQALAAGHHVTAVTRHPATFPELPEGPGALRVCAGDVFDKDEVAAAVAGQDAVVSVLGVPFTRRPVDTYSVGVGHIVAAMAVTGVERLVCVSSSTMAPPPDQDGGIVFRRAVQPFVTGVIGRTVYDDMRRMEALVRTCDRDWTIVRPSGLFAAGHVSDYRIAEECAPGRFTAREDLADCLLRQATAPAGGGGRALAVTTVTGQPSLLGMLWREGVRGGAGRPGPNAAGAADPHGGSAALAGRVG
jgi:putative NADH-flavin reductase